MLMKTILKVVPFLVVTVFCVIAFADAFNALNHGKSLEKAGSESTEEDSSTSARML